MQVITPLIIKRRSLLIRFAALVIPMVFFLLPLVQTVFAQNTFVITDGENTMLHTTFASDPVRVLNEAGIVLTAEDAFTTGEADGVSSITVQRAQTVTIDNCGQQMQVTTYGETLQSLFARVGVPMGQDYQVSAPLDTLTYDDMQVQVRYVVNSQETYTSQIPYGTVYCYSPILAEGQQKLVVPGVPGEKLCKADVVYVNTQEDSRDVWEETVLKEPVSEIVVVGTGERMDAHGDTPAVGDGFIVTTDGKVLSYSKVMQIECTAYTKTDEGCDDWTSTGTLARVGAVAVDPRVIPYGTRMFILSNDGTYVYGVATAEDCGGAIIGNRIDLYYDTDWECVRFGRRDCTVYILN